METLYTEAFFRQRQAEILQSALRIAPMIWDWSKPGRIIDLGCGCGEWLAVFEALGAVNAVGYDGPWVPKHMRCCKAFREIDLESSMPELVRWDLALCLETAEHLTPGRAKALVECLSLSRRILWSAATPGQGGTGHFNEQPVDYWLDQFRERGYSATKITNWGTDHLVAGWYRENLYWLRAQSSSPSIS